MTDGRTAVFPGTFDPFTNGHLDLTRRAARLFDKVVIAVAASPSKGTLFTVEERAEMIHQVLKGNRKVEVVHFSDLVVACARRVGAVVMIRGLRAVSDFEFEFQMGLMNRRLSPSVEVVFLMPSQRYTYLNSTLVKDVAAHGGAIKGLVPPLVERRLRERLRDRAGVATPKKLAAAPVAAPASTPRATNGAGARRATTPVAAAAGSKRPAKRSSSRAR